MPVEYVFFTEYDIKGNILNRKDVPTMFTNTGSGLWDEFVLSEDRTPSDDEVVTIDMEPGILLDKDLGWYAAFLVADSINKAEAKGKQLSQRDLNKIGSSAVKLANRTDPKDAANAEEKTLATRDDNGGESGAPSEDLGTAETVAVVGVVALLGVLGWALLRGKKKKQ